MAAPTTVCERLAEWICGLRYEDIPERVLQKARYQILNVMAGLHAGVDGEGAVAVARAVKRWRKPGACTVIPGGEQLALHEAVLVNSAASMALDYDDYLYMGHTGHSAVLGSWAVCEEEQLDTGALLVAQVIANEIGGRIGASAVLGPQNGQAWSFIHAAAGAALTAKLYRLDPARTAHALAIAMYQPPFTLWPGFMGGESKVLTAATPTVTGIQAAQLAREGLTGALDVFEHARDGFWASFTFVPLPHMLTGLGSAWVTDTLAYKRYPGCAYIDTTLDATFAALAEYRRTRGRALAPAEVRRIEVTANLLTVEMDNLAAGHADPARLAQVNVNFSIPFNVAIAVLAGKHGAAQLRQAALDAQERELRELAARVTLRHDWDMSFRVAAAFDRVLGRSSALAALSPGDVIKVLRGYVGRMGGAKKNSLDLGALVTGRGAALLGRVARGLAGRGRDGGDNGGGDTAPRDLSGVDFSRFAMTFPARVVLETTDGGRFEASQDVPFGAPGQRDYFETVEAKFRLEAAPRLSPARLEKAIGSVRALEAIPLELATQAFCGAA